MSELSPEVQGSVEPTTDTPPVENTLPYQQYLDMIPETARPLVEPAFKEWDASVTKRFQSLHSDYEPYKQFIDEYEPAAIQQALAIVQQMDSDPQKFIQGVMQAYELAQPEQGTQGNQQVEQIAPDPDDPYNQRFSQMEEMLANMANMLLSNQQTEQQRQEDAQLEEILTGLKSKHGDFDEIYVLTLMSQGMDPDAAVGQFKTTIGEYAKALNAPAAEAPVVVGGSSGVPTTPVQPGDMSSQDTKNLVIQYLEAQAAANRG